MDTNKILSADLLDLVFDNRNKDYGAYELRKHYHIRVTKALVFTGLFVAVAFTGVVMANKLKPKGTEPLLIRGVTLTSIPDDKEPEPIPETPRRNEPQQTQTVQHTTPIIVPNEEVDAPPPTVDEIDVSVIGTENKAGVAYDGTVSIETIDGDKDIIEKPVVKEPEIFTIVEVDAKYDGNWIKFLQRSLNGEVPINNGAPEGSYTVVIQFVVDIDGSISDIKALTNHGYGLEEEAIRVIKKATKWEPAMQNGRHVKAYRKQPITFLVNPEE